MKFWKIASITTALVLSTNVNALLIERLGGLAYYDTVSDLTWLADANYANTSSYSNDNANGTTFSSSTHILADGRMGWDAALTWADQLNINGITGWRLPDTLQPDPTCGALYTNGPSGFNCTGSELGNMYYNILGGEANTVFSSAHNPNYDLFSNLSNGVFWSATDATYNIYNEISWTFNMGVGAQTTKIKTFSFNAWAVHSGDVVAVPEPPITILIITGLICLIILSKRNKNHIYHVVNT
jgi:hypothetical protein